MAVAQRVRVTTDVDGVVAAVRDGGACQVAGGVRVVAGQTGTTVFSGGERVVARGAAWASPLIPTRTSAISLQPCNVVRVRLAVCGLCANALAVGIAIVASNAFPAVLIFIETERTCLALASFPLVSACAVASRVGVAFDVIGVVGAIGSAGTCQVATGVAVVPSLAA